MRTFAAGLLMASTFASACAESPIEWHTIYESSIAPNCATSACHSELSKVAGIALYSEQVAFETITGRSCDLDSEPAGGLVNTSLPEESYLLLLLRREGSLGMPPNRRLSDEEIDHIEAWIARGSLCD